MSSSKRCRVCLVSEKEDAKLKSLLDDKAKSEFFEKQFDVDVSCEEYF